MSETPFHPEAYRFASPDAGVIEWTLKRNCSLSPRQLASVYGLLCALSLLVAVFFWFCGAVLVLPFAAVELAAVGVAFLCYARHATDCERIWLGEADLVVEWETAGRVQRAEFSRQWVTVQPKTGQGSLIELRSGYRSVCVGRFLRPDLRPALAREIRFALRGHLEGAAQG